MRWRMNHKRADAHHWPRARGRADRQDGKQKPVPFFRRVWRRVIQGLLWFVRRRSVLRPRGDGRAGLHPRGGPDRPPIRRGRRSLRPGAFVRGRIVPVAGGLPRRGGFLFLPPTCGDRPTDPRRVCARGRSIAACSRAWSAHRALRPILRAAHRGRARLLRGRRAIAPSRGAHCPAPETVIRRSREHCGKLPRRRTDGSARDGRGQGPRPIRDPGADFVPARR